MGVSQWQGPTVDDPPNQMLPIQETVLYKVSCPVKAYFVVHRYSKSSYISGRNFVYYDLEECSCDCLQPSKSFLLTKHNQFWSLISQACAPSAQILKQNTEFMPIFESVSSVSVQLNLGINPKHFNLFSLPSAARKIMPC